MNTIYTKATIDRDNCIIERMRLSFWKFKKRRQLKKDAKVHDDLASNLLDKFI